MKTEILFIGVDGKQTVNSQETLKQIEKVKSLECLLEHKGEPLTWNDFDNPEEPRTLFQSIKRDRELRIDKKTFMDEDPQAYDPVKFLREAFGIPEEFSKTILYEAHDKDKGEKEK